MRLKARAVEHLDCLSSKEIDLMAHHHMPAVIMPGDLSNGAAYGQAPVGAMLDRGFRHSLTTDPNPGSRPIRNLLRTVTLAVWT